MTTAVVVFPGTNCEHDVVYALDSLGGDAQLVWHRDTDLSDFDSVVLPGGFAHGDYLRTGAIARFSPIMAEVRLFAEAGKPVLGICNGFQILCEAGLLPGVLLQNRDLAFICRPVSVRIESTDSVLTRAANVGDVLTIPLNSYEGNYTLDDSTYARLESDHHILMRYADSDGEVTPESNPNGSVTNIAAVANDLGNVAGIMPHPERATEELLGSSDGRVLLESFLLSAAGMANV
ncbi:MAG: phosphoribosylformylglycinamidine synthase I [Acidimicrobiia bacterium]|nr:phosphoribosylformylglycinamidine synthase I [Acidimicrobiia bacterium]